MTKEAKIGMLTGLAVIVLIGVLLSEYLGGPAAGAGNNVATGRMAPLPIGETKREEILQPVGVPSMARADQGTATGVLAQVPAAYAAMTPQKDTVASAAPAAPVMPEEPVVKAPVSVVPAGPVELVSAQSNDMPATVQLGDVKPAAAALSGTAMDGAQPLVKTAPAKTAGQAYVIAKGDSLDKIARKFYKADTSANRARITAANPSLMKNGQPFLIAGRTIVIPDAPAVASAAAPSAPKAATGSPAKAADAAVVIHQPGGATGGHATAVATADAPSTKLKPARTYVVKPGDSLEKIAKRVDSANYRDVEKKLMAVNGIKDAGSLQAGATLKLPM